MSRLFNIEGIDPSDAPAPSAESESGAAPGRRKGGVDFDRLRERLETENGRRLWRSLEELAETDEFVDMLHREFPENASELTDPVSRRRFLQLMGASLALAGTTACVRQSPERILPYVRQPEELVPGKPLYYASAAPRFGYGHGVLVESHMGRPTKIEGNPDHPASSGATDAVLQAEMLNLYDPDRSQVVLRRGRITTWESFLLLQRFPDARVHRFEPAGRDEVRRGAEIAFRETVDARYRFDRAAVVVSLDADFLTAMPGSVRYARDFADRRRVRADRQEMNRLYAIECTPTPTGATADHRWPVRPSAIDAVAMAIAARLGVEGAAAGALPQGIEPGWIDALADDLRAHAGASIVVAGDHQPASVHALVHAINQQLGNNGSTVELIDPADPVAAIATGSIGELVDDMRSGAVAVLAILGGNPVFDAPADLDFVGAMQSVETRLHLGMYEDETSEHCHWHLPETHFLEAWGDLSAWDGTTAVVQPLIEPLYNGHSMIEVLAVMLGQPERDGYEIVREGWRQAWDNGEVGDGDPTFEEFWQRAVHDGFIPGTRKEPRAEIALASLALGAAQPAAAGTIEVVFRPDPAIHDGRFVNNGWLQELPKPLTLLTWDNAALIGPRTAERLGVASEQQVVIELDGRSVTAPVWVMPGQPDDVVTLHFGYGRTKTGRVGTGTGFNAYAIRTSDNMWSAAGATLTATGGRVRLATTQHHHSMEGRDLVRAGTLEEFRETGEVGHGHHHEPGPEESLYPPWEYEGYSWGMTVDLNLCIGCNGCMTACQAENNVPVVGKEQVLNSRDMHWLRIDRYYADEIDNPDTYFQPVMCMHCENAPCEVVCPVAATVHGKEGLNEMVYNRCVGTRYCANNCPYKVRRFNFLDYRAADTPITKLLQNPDVTVRSRGVMEKCTYCVQRINYARIDAKNEGREIRDGEVTPACAQACPAQAITFGNINDPDSRVSRQREEPLHYGLLSELGTRPRTNYLAKLRNPNPDIESERTVEAH